MRCPCPRIPLENQRFSLDHSHCSPRPEEPQSSCARCPRHTIQFPGREDSGYISESATSRGPSHGRLEQTQHQKWSPPPHTRRATKPGTPLLLPICARSRRTICACPPSHQPRTSCACASLPSRSIGLSLLHHPYDTATCMLRSYCMILYSYDVIPGLVASLYGSCISVITEWRGMYAT